MGIFQVGGLETNINFLLSLTEHSEFRKGAVHTDFIPDHTSELFKKKQWSEDFVVFSVFGQIFSEFNLNSKTIGSKDPFVSEGCFRLNHNFTRSLNYKIDKNTDLNANLTFTSKNSVKIKYLIKEKDSKNEIENELTAEGTYRTEEGTLNIECRLKDRVSETFLLSTSFLLNICSIFFIFLYFRLSQLKCTRKITKFIYSHLRVI